MIYYSAYLSIEDYEQLAMEYSRIPDIMPAYEQKDILDTSKVYIIPSIDNYVKIRDGITPDHTMIVLVDYAKIKSLHNYSASLISRGIRLFPLTMGGIRSIDNIRRLREIALNQEEMNSCRNLLMDSKILMSRLEYLRSMET